MTLDLESAELIGKPPSGEPAEAADGDSPLPLTVSGNQLAVLLGVTTKAVTEAARRNEVCRVTRGRYDLCKSVQMYLASRIGRRGGLQDQKERLTRAQADKEEIKAAELRRELLPAAEVEREWSNILRDVRAGLLAIPSRVQQRVGTLTPHDIAAIDREIRDVLTELAGGANAAS